MLGPGSSLVGGSGGASLRSAGSWSHAGTPGGSSSWVNSTVGAAGTTVQADLTPTSRGQGVPILPPASLSGPALGYGIAGASGTTPTSSSSLTPVAASSTSALAGSPHFGEQASGVMEHPAASSSSSTSTASAGASASSASPFSTPVGPSSISGPPLTPNQTQQGGGVGGGAVPGLQSPSLAQPPSPQLRHQLTLQYQQGSLQQQQQQTLPQLQQPYLQQQHNPYLPFPYNNPQPTNTTTSMPASSTSAGQFSSMGLGIGGGGGGGGSIGLFGQAPAASFLSSSSSSSSSATSSSGAHHNLHSSKNSSKNNNNKNSNSNSNSSAASSSTAPAGPGGHPEAMIPPAPSAFRPTPQGWRCGDSAISLARIREVDSLQSNSIFAEQLPSPLLTDGSSSSSSLEPPNNSTNSTNNNSNNNNNSDLGIVAEAAGGRRKRSPRSQCDGAGLFDDEDGGRESEFSGAGDRQPLVQTQGRMTAMGSGVSSNDDDDDDIAGNPARQALQSLWNLRATKEIEVPSLNGFAKQMQSAWDSVLNSLEVLSGGWCSHQGAAAALGTQLEFRTNSGLDNMSWYVRTAPPTAAAAQRGGQASPLVGFHADDSEEGMFVNVASAHLGPQTPTRGGGGGSQFAASSELAMQPADTRNILNAARAALCSLKGNKATSPNQDRAICASLGGGLLGVHAVLDGHGESGHDVSNICVDLLPKMALRALAIAAKAQEAAQAKAQSGAQEAVGALGIGTGTGVSGAVGSVSPKPATGVEGPNPQDASSSSFAANMATDWWRESLISAFRDLHGFLASLSTEIVSPGFSEAVAASNGGGGGAKNARPLRLPTIDSRTSGTTATLVISLPQQRLLVAHVGDSRGVIGIRPKNAAGPWRVSDLTRDHKPDLPDENTRIEHAGATVVGVGVPPNATHRVFSAHQTWPSINMSRSLGDLHAHSQGLTCIPEVLLTDPLWNDAEEEAVLVLASDGIWDVVPPAAAIQIVAQATAQSRDPSVALAHAAYERWGWRGLQGNYSDDITALVRFL